MKITALPPSDAPAGQAGRGRLVGHRCGSLTVLLSVVLGVTAISAPVEFDWGPLVSRQVDAAGHTRFRALGPFYEHVSAPSGRELTAVRPFHALSRDPARDMTHRDIVWPIAQTMRVGDESRWRVLLAYGFDHDRTDPGSRARTWILPVWFQGRDKVGEPYFALFPLGGRLADFGLMDESVFALWPLYVKSRKKETVSHTFLWPFISKAHGGGVDRFRVFPFYGHNRHEGEYRKTSVLWPFWTSAHYEKGGQAGKAWVLFPLVGHMDMANQDTWLFLPPFIRVSKGERENLTYGPWPFIQLARGEVEKTYIWPLWGTKRSTSTRSRFLLWPFMESRKIDRGSYLLKSKRFSPFLFIDEQKPRDVEEEAAPDVTRRRVKVWPLYSSDRRGDAYRFRSLELWPFRRNPRPIERSWAPFWTLWSYTRDGGSADTEVLWGLYRRARRGEAYRRTSLFPLVSWERDTGSDDVRQWDLLKGLVGYRREGSTKAWRLLYFLRWGGDPDTP